MDKQVKISDYLVNFFKAIPLTISLASQLLILDCEGNIPDFFQSCDPLLVPGCYSQMMLWFFASQSRLQECHKGSPSRKYFSQMYKMLRDRKFLWTTWHHQWQYLLQLLFLECLQKPPAKKIQKTKKNISSHLPSVNFLGLLYLSLVVLLSKIIVFKN